MIRLEVRINTQTLLVFDNEKLIKEYIISSAKNGVGECDGSEQTPRGWHEIRAKIGSGCAVNSVFVGRKPTGEIFSHQFRKLFPERDWILTRLLWLRGLEIGKNRLGKVDSMRRYIYIHGTPDDEVMGVPNSKGCLRMRNDHIIELFDIVPVGTRVLIK